MPVVQFQRGRPGRLQLGNEQGFFPLPVLWRYLVLAWRWSERAGLLDASLQVLRASEPPFLGGDIPWSASKPVLLTRRERPVQPRPD